MGVCVRADLYLEKLTRLKALSKSLEGNIEILLAKLTFIHELYVYVYVNQTIFRPWCQLALSLFSN